MFINIFNNIQNLYFPWKIYKISEIFTQYFWYTFLECNESHSDKLLI